MSALTSSLAAPVHASGNKTAALGHVLQNCENRILTAFDPVDDFPRIFPARVPFDPDGTPLGWEDQLALPVREQMDGSDGILTQFGAQN